jgi:hypothetical protein
MNVLGHNHIPDHNKLVAPSDLLKDFQEAIAATGFAENRVPVIAATRDEVKMSGVVLSSQSARHENRLEIEGSPVCDICTRLWYPTL